MIRILFALSLLFVFSCEDPVSSPDPQISKIYVCDQGSDRVVVLDATTDDLSQITAVDIDFSDTDMGMMEVPHFVAIDELNGYWFVTAFQSGYVGMYDLDEDTFISKIALGSDATPALLAIDKSNKMLYVSQMMEMGTSMPGGEDFLYSLNYSSGELVDAGGVNLTSEDIIDFPAPHAISIDFNTVRGTSLLTASHSADWFSMTRLDNATITPSAYPLSPPEEYTDDNDNGVYDEGESFIDADGDGYYDEPNFIATPDSGYRPLDVTQKDDFIFFSCLGDDIIGGQVQSWSLSNFNKKSVYEFGVSTKPWHIISSPVANEIFVVLSGSEGVDAGLSCLSYNENGELSERWTTTDSSFDTLHGVVASSDGTRVYVSSRGNGSIYVFDALSGSLLNTVEEIGDYMSSLSGIAITQ